MFRKGKSILLVQITINRNTVHFSSSFPSSLSGHLLFNSECFYAEGSYGSLLLQRLQAAPFVFLYTIITTQEEVSIELALSSEGVICQFVLERPVKITSAQTGERELHAQSITLFSAQAWQGRLLLGPAQTYSFISVLYPLSFVWQQLVFFPAFEQWKEQFSRSLFLFPPNGIYPLSVSCSGLLHSLLHTPYIPLTQSFYHHLLKLLLGEVLRSLQSEKRSDALFSLADVDRIRSAKEWIENHLDTHFSTQQVARKAGINEYKLKKGFKALYGCGMYAYLLRQRLVIAKLALEQTRKPIKQIARQAGYSTVNNFAIAFKRRFGVTPYEYRFLYGS